MNFYNENDPKAAAWLRELIAQGHIPPGDVDTRSITDISPNELTGYTQHHFFAGIGGWSLALKLAGWPATRSVWTGSCPCQPFSAAGKQRGTTDERHLWPVFHRLIDQCRPEVVFGEQVCSMEVIAGKQGKGLGISEEVSLEESREGLDSSRPDAGSQEATILRPIRFLSRNSGSNRQGSVRGLGPSVESAWWENVGQSLDRQADAIGGVYLSKHPHSLSCGEQRVGRLGRRDDADDRAFDHGSANSALQRALGIARKEFDDAIGGAWSAGVRADLEASGYSFGACDVPAAGVGAPHIRQRLFWVADPGHKSTRRGARPSQTESGRAFGDASGRGASGGMADSDATERRPDSAAWHNATRENPGRAKGDIQSRTNCAVGGLEHAQSDGRQQRRTESGGRSTAGRCGVSRLGSPNLSRCEQQRGAVSVQPQQPPAELSGHTGSWSAAQLIPCADGKARRIEPGSFPLAHGVSGRVGLLRGYGNAIVPQIAAEFIQAFLES